MAKKLDFNALERPVLELTLKDDAKTVVRVEIPTEELVERLQSAASEMQKVINDETGVLVKACFDLAAELINCNADGLVFTAEDLRDKYKMKLYDLTVFFKVYLDFIQEVSNAKN